MDVTTDICIETMNKSISKIDDTDILAELNSTDMSPNKNTGLVRNKDDSSDDDSAPVLRIRKRLQQFSDSDTEKENFRSDSNTKNDVMDSLSDEIENSTAYKSRLLKSRLQQNESSSDSEAPEECSTVKYKEQQIRIKNKRNKMAQKFQGLLKSRSKQSASNDLSEQQQSSEDDKNMNSDSQASGDEMSSINIIKQKIKKSMIGISSICDPDTSDEEGNMNNRFVSKQKQKKMQKSTKIIEAKPVRMSAKQAIENMQLIKSESNRMLREKAVSLPYHRPKALSLKDIMSRRKPALTSDGKALPIKMNEEQLKQYALQLEQRQKEMMELCKSESDEDATEPAEKSEKTEGNTSENKEIETDINIEKLLSNEEPSNTEEKESEIYVGIDKDEANGKVHSVEHHSEKITSTQIETEGSEDNIQERNESMNSETNQNDSNTDIRLIYNDDSIEEEKVPMDRSQNVSQEDEINKNVDNAKTEQQNPLPKMGTKQDSQLISFQYTENGTEASISETNCIINDNSKQVHIPNKSSEQIDDHGDNLQDEFFSDDDVNMEDIDKIIENAEIMKEDVENTYSPMLIKDPLTMKPKLMGAPGMVIDLDGTDPMIPKRSGVELLKERFTFFSKLKTPEELERERERKLKPGAQHLKLKQKLEESIAEQRSLEWAKRLEEEKQLHDEMDTILDDADGVEDSIEKDNGEKINEKEESDSGTEDDEELVENDIEVKDKPRKHNPMVDDEAEESDVDENYEENGANEVEDNAEDDDSEESSEDDESSESEEEDTTKPKKGRILKAFEDSDDEDSTAKHDVKEPAASNIGAEDKITDESEKVEAFTNSCEVQTLSQDDVIQLAQRHKSASDDLFSSQEKLTPNQSNKDGNESEEVLGTQTFSISCAKPNDFLCPSQPYHDPNLNNVTDGISQNVLGSQLPTSQSSQSQPIGEDILALCTGKFYDNEFVSTVDNQTTELISQDAYNFVEKEHEPAAVLDKSVSSGAKNLSTSSNNGEENKIKRSEESSKKSKEDGNLLKSILDELDDPEFDKPKTNKYFTGASQNNNVAESTQSKKRLVIDSDEDTADTRNITDQDVKKKKKYKKKMEKRALQISDDEEDQTEGLGFEDDEYLSELEEDSERVVEYDSEENEVEVKADKPKKKRKATDFFEQEAELTSEDEWVGSGDEDEHGLDRMEREEGDDEVFHQGKLRKELGQIHMRDVLDQDKREVRLLQELLFEDGDLGGGHRQRKFRWRNAGDEEAGTIPDEFGDTQEEEFESEEQWRKQRHERAVFLRQMQKQDEEEGSLNVTVNRTTIIKANLVSKSMSALLMEANQSKTETIENAAVPEKKSAKDIPSPKKGFSILQQNYHSSLLTRGRGALARLAALATPLAADDDAPKISSLASRKRNFVFAALTPDEDQPKVTIKRKADVNLGTPKLVKKMRIEEKQSHHKSSLLDHLNT